MMAVLAGKLEAPARGLRAGRRQIDAQPAGAEQARTDALPQDQPQSGGDGGISSSSCSWRRMSGLPSRTFSTSMQRTIRCTASRRDGSSTAITIALATVPLYVFCRRPFAGGQAAGGRPGRGGGRGRGGGARCRRIRARWPRTRILLRANSGFAREDDHLVRGQRGRLPVRAHRTNGSWPK